MVTRRENTASPRRTRSQRSSTPATPALPAKLARPTASGLIPRERLFERLDQSLARKVVWITGPGGAGKTSLVSTYLETRGLDHIWYQVDASDADLASFTHYLRLAVRDYPGEPLPAFTAAHFVELEAFARRFFEAFFTRFQAPVALVFDNYQEVPADSGFHDFFVALLDHLSEHARVVVLSRAEPPAALAKWSLHPEFTTLDWREVQFSAEETAALAWNWGIKRLEDVSTLHEMSRGWVAGMVMMRRASQRGVDLARAQNEPPRQLFNYFASQIWSRIPAATQSFLCSTAFLPRMTAAAAQALTGDSQAARILADLHAENFFTDRRPGPESVYEYHPLFREFLVVRAAEALSPEALAARQREAAALLESSGEVAAAAELLVAARDRQGLRALVERHAERMVDQARFHTLRTWLDALPAQDVADAPWLLLWLGLCKAAARDATFRASLERSCELFDAASDLVGSCAARGWLFQTARSAAELEELLAQVAEQLERQPPVKDPQVEARIIRNFNADVRLPARHPLWTFGVERADGLARRLPEPGQRLRMAGFAGLAYAYLGDITKLRSVLAATGADLAAPGVSVRDRYVFLNVQSTEAFFSGEFRAAEEATATLEAEANASPLDQMGPMLMGLRHRLVSGDADAVRQWDERMNQTPTFVSRMRANQLLYGAAARLACGDLDGAWSKASEASSLMTPRSVGFSMSLSTKAMVLLARGENEDARTTLEHAVAVARELNGPLVLFPALQLLAVAEHRLDHIDRALAHLREGMRLARETRCITGRPLLSIALFAELAELALANGIEVEHTKEIVGKLKLRPRSPELDTWPWPLRIRALGMFEVHREGAETDAEPSAGKKKPKKPFELLQYLIAHGGAAVSSAAVTDALWPDAEGDAGKRSFDVTLYRLRKLLGSDEAIRLEGAKLSLNSAMCWIDCFAFERLAAGLDEISDTPALERVDKLAGRALDLYRGHFLAGEEAYSWASAYREKLRSGLIQVVERAGDRLESTERSGAAEQLYRRALQLDPVAEAIYRRLIRALARRGEKAEAVEVYRRCREMLSIVLNVQPALETERLYETLRQSG
jgi:LuxR family maltose regulon positive regulatory protein